MGDTIKLTFRGKSFEFKPLTELTFEECVRSINRDGMARGMLKVLKDQAVDKDGFAKWAAGKTDGTPNSSVFVKRANHLPFYVYSGSMLKTNGEYVSRYEFVFSDVSVTIKDTVSGDSFSATLKEASENAPFAYEEKVEGGNTYAAIKETFRDMLDSPSQVAYTKFLEKHFASVIHAKMLEIVEAKLGIKDDVVGVDFFTEERSGNLSEDAKAAAAQ